MRRSIRTERKGKKMTAEEIIHSIDIVDYISQFTDLELRGDEYWGLSPLKQEKTPSFSIRPEEGCFYDYSSGIGGNVYTFAKAYFGCSNYEAMCKLKAFAGIDDSQETKTERMSATSVAKKYLPPQRKQKECTAQVLPDNYMDRYERRDDKLDAWRREGISDEALDRFIVRYDGFSDRLVYPIRNPDGTIINVGGRTLDSRWKEKKLRKYNYYFNWGTIETIYGLAENTQEIRNKHEIILFEGAKSVMLAYSWGIRNCGAILTSHLNPSQMKLLIKLGVDVVFALDKEIDITEDKHISLLRNFTNVYMLWDKDNFLDDKDAPVDKGKEVFEEIYSNRVRYK